jgi:hypothetical protein
MNRGNPTGLSVELSASPITPVPITRIIYRGFFPATLRRMVLRGLAAAGRAFRMSQTAIRVLGAPAPVLETRVSKLETRVSKV